MIEFGANARRVMMTHRSGIPPEQAAVGLPEVPPTDQDAGVQDRAVAAPTPRPLRAVIVEDEAIIAMDLEMQLEDLGIEVVGTAMTAADAEALVSTLQPDFVTMDIHIKGNRDGVDVACAIFERHGVGSIFVSAFGDAATKARAAAARPLGWVRKPVDPEDLAEAVKRVERNKT